MTLSAAQLTDVRRFAGYPAFGTTEMMSDTYDTVFVIYGMVEMSLYTRLTTLSASEEAVLTTTYLAQIYTLETGIVGSAANLDTAAAAVWTHNANEVRDRSALFNQWCVKMCQFLGLAPGPGLNTGSTRLVRG